MMQALLATLSKSLDTQQKTARIHVWLHHDQSGVLFRLLVHFLTREQYAHVRGHAINIKTNVQEVGNQLKSTVLTNWICYSYKYILL